MSNGSWWIAFKKQVTAGLFFYSKESRWDYLSYWLTFSALSPNYRPAPFSFLPSLFFQHFLTMIPHPHLLFQIFTLPKGKSFGHFCFREENSNRTFLLSGRKQQLDIFAFRKKTAKGYFQRSYNLFIRKTNVHFGNVLIMIKSVFRTIGSHVRQF